jgi:hypothetical protein
MSYWIRDREMSPIVKIDNSHRDRLLIGPDARIEIQGLGLDQNATAIWVLKVLPLLPVPPADSP